MKPLHSYITNPDLDNGGAIVPFIGPPGCGKTNTLTQLGLMRKNEGHKVLWRATEQCEWGNFLANGEEAVFWKHESIDELETWISNKEGIEHKDIDSLEAVQVREWSESEELVKNLLKDKINVVAIPGLNGENYQKYFFMKKWIDVLKALTYRKDVFNPVTFLTDEAGDIWPYQGQLKNPFYSLVAIRSPPLLAQLRKQNVFLYLACHSTTDIHNFVWKVKGNTIAYMAHSNVKKELHSQVDQSKVNRLDKGEIIVPPMDRDEFSLAYETKDLEWVDGGKLRMRWHSEIPNLIDGDDKDDGKMSDSEAAAKLYNETSYTQSKAADIFDVSQQALSKVLNE